MRIEWMTAFADVPAEHISAAAQFWSAVTGARARAATGSRGEFVPLDPPDGDSYVWLQRVDRPEPGWHLDLHLDDRHDGVRRAVSLGAVVIEEQRELAVLATPAGQPFCLLGEPGRRRRPEPFQCPDGHRSIADQICFDLPPSAVDRDVEFWAGFTEWTRRYPSLPEFEAVVRPAEVPLRLLFQRLGRDEEDAAPRAHLDLSSDDVPAERDRHVTLGAEVVRVAEHWTTLRDPAGLLYCITDREPGR